MPNLLHKMRQNVYLNYSSHTVWESSNLKFLLQLIEANSIRGVPNLCSLHQDQDDVDFTRIMKHTAVQRTVVYVRF